MASAATLSFGAAGVAGARRDDWAAIFRWIVSSEGMRSLTPH
jgi:hypothetical protein